jgi:transcriptional regulator with XRE-family HTH domain
MTARATDIDRRVGRRIRDRRRTLGLTQTDLALRVGCGACQISNYELGHDRVSAGMLVAIAEALGTTTTWLLDATEGPVPGPPTVRMLQEFMRLPAARQEALLALVHVMADCA